MAANDNPYLALLQQEAKPPGWAQILQHIGNLGFGLAGGFGQAAATGQPTMSAIGPGLMMGNQLNAQAAQQAEQERMKRLELQFKAQEHEDKRAEVLRKQKAMDDLSKLGFNAVAPQGPLMGPSGTPTTGTGTSDQNAIGGIESGGRYDAVGPVANKAGNRAYGKYQIMDFNVGPWTQEVFGKAMTPQEFLANPQAQDAVFNAKFGQYSKKYGPVGASRAWFAGEGGMNNPNASDVNGMTVQRYGDQFARRRGVASTPVGPGGVALPPVAPGGAGPTFSALPAFEGRGLENTIQPGALPAGVEPKVNLPAPFVPPTAPGTPTPGGPNVVQAQATPGPNTPPMTPGGAPAPGGVPGIEPPPVRVRPPPATLTPEENARLAAAYRGGALTYDQAQTRAHQIIADKTSRQDAAADAQHQAELKAWEARNQLSLEQYKIAQGRADEQRRRTEEGAFVRDPATGLQTWRTKAEMQSGMTQADKPPEPPAPGTQAGDDHILSTAPKDSVEYKNAFDRKASEPKIINGQAYVRDMSKVPPPTYGQPAGAPAAAPAPAPAAKSDIPGMTPVGGGVSSTEMANLRIARTEAETLVKALEDFKQEFKKAGTMDSALSLGGSNTPLNTSYNVAALLAKGDQLFKLGVLSGPDLDIIRRTLPDPSTFRGAMTKTADMEAAVDKVTGLIEAKLRAHEKNLGVEPANIRPAPASAPAAASPNGPAGAQPPAAGAVAQPKTKAEYDALPKGTPYIHPTLGPKVKQ